MTQQGITAIERMDGSAAVQAEDAFKLLDVIGAERVLLNVHPASEAASAAPPTGHGDTARSVTGQRLE
ncbi:hypothetical protein OG429_02835 [Streptomyces sp. NBC_00190]|uniref:hypothetical protein n=1 Tax=unclassified Streptomyces TaxID=2593676 RepID=UPI002E27EE03|nr:hypothetical protein [Streptomyces sp. NBC_00190]WSZ38351.1 hypothetical protein OG239_05845 [Streptomyces sp. NBC_00868]